MAQIVSQLSQIIQILIPLIVDEQITVRANKLIKFGEKHRSETYSDQVGAIIGFNGRLDGFDLSEDGLSITIAPGKFICDGVVAETDDSTTIVDPGTYSAPYYIYGLPRNDSDYPGLEFGFTDSTDTGCIIAINNGSWVNTDTIELGKLWRLLLQHIDDDLLHTISDYSEGMVSGDLANAANPYATKADTFVHDSTTAHYSLAALHSLIELESSELPTSFSNMFADTISSNGKILPVGKYGTLEGLWDNGVIGPLGGFSTDSELSIDTGIFAKAENLVDHLVIAAKVLRVQTSGLPSFDIMTDGSSYQITGAAPNRIIDTTPLSPSSSGLYEFQIRMNLPSVSGSDYWTTKNTLINPTCMHASQYINSRMYMIGGLDAYSADAGIQQYGTETDSVSIFMPTINRSSVPTSKNTMVGKINIFNSLDSALSIVSDISELTISNKSIFTAATGLEYWGSCAAELADNEFKSVFGTGESSGSYKNDWKLYNSFTRVVSSLTNYPSYASGVSLASSPMIPRKIYSYGAHGVSGTISRLLYYDAYTRTFTTISATEIGAPDRESKSYGESLEASGKNNILYAGRAYGAFGAETFAPDINEYSPTQNTLTRKTNLSVNIGHSAFCLTSNGRMYNSGGRTSNSGAGLSDGGILEYTSSAMYLSGWGMKWR